MAVRRLLGILVVALLAAAPVAPAAAERPAAALDIAGDGGRELLAGRTLGLRAGGRWHEATRLLSRGDARTLRFATTDPAGRELVVRTERRGRGRHELEVAARPSADAVRAGFALRADERQLGFGERSNAVDQRGRVVENLVTEGPYQPDELGILGQFVPPWALSARDDATYFPMPWLLSTAGYGVLVRDDEPSRFHLGTDDPETWSVEADAAALRLLVLEGPRPADVLRRLTEVIGRQPAVVPEVFGTWHHSEARLGDETRRIDDLQRAGVPLSVAQIYTQYLPCARHRGQEARQRGRVALFHGRGLAATTYVNPQMCVEHPQYAEAVASGALTRDGLGGPYLYRFSVRRDLVGQFDFTAPAGRELYGRLVGEALADGHDGWMEDYGEYSPPDAVAADGRPGPATHNSYPRDFHCATAAATAAAPRPLIRYVRSGWTGSARCSPVVWGGDPTVGWGFDGLRSALTNGLTMGLSGVSTWGSDIGGFFAFFDRALSPELLTRWIQLGAVSGVMRLQATGIAIPEKPRAQPWEAETLPQWRRWAKLRTQLYPYVDAADAEYRRSGLPIMRHLALTEPGDARAAAVDDAFLFGGDVLAAPVLDPGLTTRSVHLPRGPWVDLWRSARYVEHDGSLALGRAAVLRGGRSVTVPAPLEELPLFVRGGALLPLLPPDVETLSAYGDGPQPAAVSLADRADERRLLAFPYGDTAARVGARDGRIASHERDGRWVLRFATRRALRWELQASLATLRRPFRPCRVTLDGRPLRREAWSHDLATGVLRASLTTREGRLEVSRRCRR